MVWGTSPRLPPSNVPRSSPSRRSRGVLARGAVPDRPGTDGTAESSPRGGDSRSGTGWTRTASTLVLTPHCDALRVRRSSRWPPRRWCRTTSGRGTAYTGSPPWLGRSPDGLHSVWIGAADRSKPAAGGLRAGAKRQPRLPRDREHDRHLLLVPPGDVEEPSSAVVGLIGDPSLRHRLFHMAQARAREHFDQRWVGPHRVPAGPPSRDGTAITSRSPPDRDVPPRFREASPVR